MSSLIAFVVAAAPSSVFGENGAATERRRDGHAVTCKVTQAFYDGDTFTCLTNEAGQQGLVVRIAGIDAPERGQAYWRVARDELRLLLGEETAVSCHKTDRYGRQVCRVRSSKGVDVGESMLRAGLAWHYVQYASEQSADEASRYAAAEAAARAERRGLWVEREPIAPWDCRALRRASQRCR